MRGWLIELYDDNVLIIMLLNCILHISIDPEAAQKFIDPEQSSLDALNGLDWAENPVLTTSLFESITNATNVGICYTTEVRKLATGVIIHLAN